MFELRAEPLDAGSHDDTSSLDEARAGRDHDHGATPNGFYSVARQCPDCDFETLSRDAYWAHRHDFTDHEGSVLPACAGDGAVTAAPTLDGPTSRERLNERGASVNTGRATPTRVSPSPSSTTKRAGDADTSPARATR